MQKNKLTIFIILLFMVSVFMPHRLFALPETKQDFPKLANYFLHWTVSEKEAKELAEFDLVILDADVQERSKRNIELIRDINPDIILLAYIPASEIRRDVKTLDTISPLRYRLGGDISDVSYLKNANNERLSFWPGTWIVDVTNSAPEAQTKYGSLRWNEYLPHFVTNEIFTTGLWDGVIYDNAWDDIVHFAKGVPDINRDGKDDNVEQAREEWKNGLKTIYRKTIELNPNKLVFENDGPIYASEVHGVLIESFPRKGWDKHSRELKTVIQQTKSPSIGILNANTFNTGRRYDWRSMRYGFASALLFDAYFSFDFGDQDHGQTWLYDEYDVFLGEPINSPRVAYGLNIRDFEQGIVFANTTDIKKTINLSLEVEKIKGKQDTTVNDGLITQTISVNSKDGLVVLRPLRKILNAVYENGVFARVFNARGEATRAGFFAFDKDLTAGSVIAIYDLDGDKRDDRVSVVGKNIRVLFGDGRISNILPFGQAWSGDINISVGDVNNDGILEIIAVQGLGGGQARVYRPNGTLISNPFFPFGPIYKGGVNVAVGDLNGDGFSEIVVGAGPGGGPQVRIFAGDGRLLSGGFFAYDPRFRGGVRVAVGDTDGDGNSEIVTGSGVGGGPQVRLFNGKGHPLSPGFFAYDRSSRNGVIPVMTDINNDGKKEILAITKEVF